MGTRHENQPLPPSLERWRCQHVGLREVDWGIWGGVVNIDGFGVYVGKHEEQGYMRSGTTISTARVWLRFDGSRGG